VRVLCTDGIIWDTNNGRKIAVNFMESQKFKQIEEKFVMYIGLPLFGCFLIYLWFFEGTYAEHFMQQSFSGVIQRKELSIQKPDSYWYLTLQTLHSNNLDTTQLTFPNLKYPITGFEDLYDYLQVGDTVYKIKDSLVVEVKNGVRHRVFRGEEKKR
jgi:hypothetical protein